jgi:hypothetical protein
MKSALSLCCCCCWGRAPELGTLLPSRCPDRQTHLNASGLWPILNFRSIWGHLPRGTANLAWAGTFCRLNSIQTIQVFNVATMTSRRQGSHLCSRTRTVNFRIAEWGHTHCSQHAFGFRISSEEYEDVSKSFRTGRLGARTTNGTALCH